MESKGVGAEGERQRQKNVLLDTKNKRVKVGGHGESSPLLSAQES